MLRGRNTQEEWNFAEEEADVETIKVLVKGIRNIRSEMNVPPSRKAKYFIVSPDENLRELFASHKDIYSQLISAMRSTYRQTKPESRRMPYPLLFRMPLYTFR
ncbi:hypothetical protein [Eubacterium ramulus]|uniref:hypothetical protein n=1 Tax=Eubacterium ramulus TaxID=39490 RepID=UPI003521DB5F